MVPCAPVHRDGEVAIRPRTVSLIRFAKAMLLESQAFADRVHAFEERFGHMDDDMLAVLAQATYLCWFETDYREDLMALCRAIATGRPTHMTLCRQIGPARWLELHSYVVGLQRWLDLGLAAPPNVDGHKVAQIGQWLGERHPAKEALAAILLSQIVSHLLQSSFALLGERPASSEGTYAGYGAWYARPDGGRHGRETDASFLARCEARVRHEMASTPGDAETLLRELGRATQPPCMHRYQRYLDIRIASIGALRWRGQSAGDDGSKESWRAFWEQAEAGLHAWVDAQPPRGEMAQEIYRALGKPSLRGQAVVSSRLGHAPPEGFFQWLIGDAEEAGSTAGTLLGHRWARENERAAEA